MTIGILTYQYAMNYGAVLQAYALKSYLEKQGYSVEVLNYDTSYLYEHNRSILSRTLSKVWQVFRSVLGGAIKRHKFESFRKRYLNLSEKKLTSFEELKEYVNSNIFDAFIVGSDQVWNPEINGRDIAYYLSFAKNEKKISYAASFGVNQLNVCDLQNIVERLQSFTSISVREKSAISILRDLNKEIKVVLDPVFLLDVEQWEFFSGNIPLVRGDYVLCYVMPGDRLIEHKIEVIAKQIKERFNLKVIFIGRKEYKKFDFKGSDFVSASPNEFVNLFRFAKFVITNSFHGTAFSLILNKPFYSVINQDLSGNKQLCSRIVDLLSGLGLSDRIITPSDTPRFGFFIEYNKVNDLLNENRNASKHFLIDSLTFSEE